MYGQFLEHHIIGYNNAWGRIFPVIYGNKRIDSTEYAIYLFQMSFLQQVIQSRGITLDESMMHLIVPCPDEFMVTKLALKKSCAWKSEGEWRMFYVPYMANVNEEQHSFVFQKPSAIYLGRKISDSNQKILIDIAKEKEIPVYKMGFSEKSITYTLRPYKLKI